MTTIFKTARLDHVQLDRCLTTLKGYSEEFAVPVPGELLNAEVNWRTKAEAKLVIAGLGKVGKSSLLEALLGTSLLIPVDLEIATATAFWIRHGTDQRYVVHFLPKEGEAAAQEPVTIPIAVGDDSAYKAMLEYGSNKSNPNNIKLVDRIEVVVNSSLLPPGVVLIDTPGIDSFSWEHTLISWRTYPVADAVFFVVDGTRSVLTRPEADAIERLIGWQKPITVLHTKCDEPSEEATAALEKENRKALGLLLGTAPETLPYFKVSSRMKASHARTGREDYLHASGFLPLMNAIRLDFHASVRANAALPVVFQSSRWLQSENDRLKELRRINSEANTDVLKSLGRAKEQQLAMRRAFLKTQLPEILKEFDRACVQARDEANHSISEKLDNQPLGTFIGPLIEDLRRGKISAKEIVQNDDAYRARLLNDGEGVVRQISRHYEGRLKDAMIVAHEALGDQDAAEAEITRMAWEPNVAAQPNANFTAVNRGAMSDLMAVQQGMGLGGMLGSAGAAVVASVFAIPPLGAIVAIGILLTVTVASLFGRRAELRERALSELQSRLSFVARKMTEGAHQSVRTYNAQVVPEMRARLLQRAEAPQATLENEIKTIEQRVRATEEQAAKHEAALIARAGKLSMVYNEYKSVHASQ
jgi:GTPase SAR1 family protein